MFLLQQSKLVLLFSIFFIFINVAISQIPSANEKDSVRAVLNRCNTDSCRFYVLSDLFWKYYNIRYEYSKFYGEWALQIMTKISLPRIIADGYHIKAHLLKDKGNVDSAYYFFAKTLDISQAIDYHFKTGWSYYRLGEIDLHRGYVRKAISEIVKACEYFTKSGQFNEVAMCNTSLATIYKMLGQKDSALYFYDKNLELSRKIPNNTIQVYSYLDMYGFFKEMNDYHRAVQSLYKAIERAEILKEAEPLFYVYLNAGLLFITEKKDNDIAISYYQKAMNMAKVLDRHELIAMLNIFYSKHYIENKAISTALEYLKKCLDISKQISNPCTLSELYYYLGVTYQKMDNDFLALKYYNLCLGTKGGCSEWYNTQALLSIGDICMKLKRSDKAIMWYKQALSIAERSDAKSNISSATLKIGNYYRCHNQIDRAEKLFLQSIKNARDDNNIKLIKDAADSLASLYETMGNYKLVNHYLRLSSAMRDSLTKAEKLANITQLQMQLELKRMKEEDNIKILQATEKARRQQLFLQLLLLIIFLITTVGFVVFVAYRQKKRDNFLLMSKNEEIFAQKNEIERISQKLHEADEMKLRFFMNVSHDLRTPLTLIIAPLVKLIRESSNEMLKNTYVIMLHNARNLQLMINQLLDISKLDKGELTLSLKPHHLNRQVKAICAMFQSLAEEKRITLRIVEKSKTLIFNYDYEKIDQIINNLLSNAFKFTPNNGKIVLTLACSEDTTTKSRKFAEIIVKDNGIGISPEYIDKIFDRFFQCPNAGESPFKGSGIGLSVVKEHVELHGGNIEVCSELGKGTKFIIQLPMIVDEKGLSVSDYNECFDEHLYLSQSNKEKKTSKCKGTILIVEDNVDLRVYLADSISSEFNVMTATNGDDGIKLATKYIPDLIISDIIMPMKDGYELTSELRNNLETSHIPIILLTAKTEKQSKIEGLKRGANDYLCKPFDEDELLLKIKNSLQHRKKLQEKYRKQITVNPAMTDIESLDEKFLIRITNIIEKEISNSKLNGDYIAKEIGMSRSQLYRKLMAITGYSINCFIRSIRLKKAAQMLQKNAVTISEAAYLTGFESLSYFTKKFKEEFGKLPSEFHSIIK